MRTAGQVPLYKGKNKLKERKDVLQTGKYIGWTYLCIRCQRTQSPRFCWIFFLVSHVMSMCCPYKRNQKSHINISFNKFNLTVTENWRASTLIVREISTRTFTIALNISSKICITFLYLLTLVWTTTCFLCEKN